MNILDHLRKTECILMDVRQLIAFQFGNDAADDAMRWVYSVKIDIKGVFELGYCEELLTPKMRERFENAVKRVNAGAARWEHGELLASMIRNCPTTATGKQLWKLGCREYWSWLFKIGVLRKLKTYMVREGVEDESRATYAFSEDAAYLALNDILKAYRLSDPDLPTIVPGQVINLKEIREKVQRFNFSKAHHVDMGPEWTGPGKAS